MFWDSSAVVPLLVPEEHPGKLAALLGARDSPPFGGAPGWNVFPPCTGAQREASLPERVLKGALMRLEALLESADTIPATDLVRRRAARLLATHPLRAADALQLGAALVCCEERPDGEKFVCLDTRLREVARREGFEILPD